MTSSRAVHLVPVEVDEYDRVVPASPLCPLSAIQDGVNYGSSCSADGSGCMGFAGVWTSPADAHYTMCRMPGQPTAAEHFAHALAVLSDLAFLYRDEPRVIGFRVFGNVDDFEAAWNADARAPLRWRSGEWRLYAGRDGFEPVFRKDDVMREPIVKFYKSFEQGGNGAFATATTAAEPEEFLRECAAELETVVTARAGDLHFTFDALLPQICELWARLKGYKADGVFEKRYLVAGEPNPEAHMECVNGREVTTSAS